MNIFTVMIKSIIYFLIIFCIFQQFKSQISQIDQNGYNAFCDETLHLFSYCLENVLSIIMTPRLSNLVGNF